MKHYYLEELYSIHTCDIHVLILFLIGFGDVVVPFNINGNVPLPFVPPNNCGCSVLTGIINDGGFNIDFVPFELVLLVDGPNVGVLLFENSVVVAAVVDGIISFGSTTPLSLSVLIEIFCILVPNIRSPRIGGRFIIVE